MIFEDCILKMTFILEWFFFFFVGGRSCLGEALARVNIFMFFTGLLHQFTFSTPPGTTPPSLEPIMTSTLNPQPFSIHVTQR